MDKFQDGQPGSKVSSDFAAEVSEVIILLKLYRGDDPLFALNASDSLS